MFPILRRDFLNIVKNPALLFANTLFPFLLVAIIGGMSGGMFATDAVSAHDYYAVSILVFTALNISIISPNTFMEVSVKKANLRIGYSPVKPWQIYVSKIVSTFVFALLCLGLLSLLFFVLYGVDYGGRFLPFFALVGGLSLFASTLGVTMAVLFKDEESANQLLGVLNIVFAFMGGIFFHPRILGETFARASVVSPARWVLEGTFRIIFDDDLGLALPILAVFAGLVILFLAICKKSFRLEDYV